MPKKIEERLLQLVNDYISGRFTIQGEKPLVEEIIRLVSPSLSSNDVFEVLFERDVTTPEEGAMHYGRLPKLEESSQKSGVSGCFTTLFVCRHHCHGCNFGCLKSTSAQRIYQQPVCVKNFETNLPRKLVLIAACGQSSLVSALRSLRSAPTET